MYVAQFTKKPSRKVFFNFNKIDSFEILTGSLFRNLVIKLYFTEKTNIAKYFNIISKLSRALPITSAIQFICT